MGMRQVVNGSNVLRNRPRAWCVERNDQFEILCSSLALAIFGSYEAQHPILL